METGLSDKRFNTRMIVLVFIISFVFSDFIRSYLFSNLLGVTDYNAQNINFYVAICLILIVINQINNGVYNISILFLWVLGTLLTLIVLYKSSSGMWGYSIFLICYMIPLLLLGVKISKEDLPIIFSKCLNLLNILVCTIFIIGIYDYLTKGGFQAFLMQQGFFNERYVELVSNGLTHGVFRYYSIFGHPLRTAQLFLTFFILNSIFNKYFYVKMNPLVISVITLVGVTLSNSKTGVLLSLILILFFSTSKSLGTKVFYWIASLIALFFLLSSQLFSSTVLERVSKTSDDLSGGRTELVQAIIDGTIERPKLIGGGPGYSQVVKETTSSEATSFEYPFIMFSYDLGIGITILMYIILFIYPLMKLILHRNYYLAGLFLILTLDVNSYNGLTNTGDFMIQFGFVIFLILNVNYYVTELYGKKFYKIRWNYSKNSNGIYNEKDGTVLHEY